MRDEGLAWLVREDVRMNLTNEPYAIILMARPRGPARIRCGITELANGLEWFIGSL